MIEFDRCTFKFKNLIKKIEDYMFKNGKSISYLIIFIVISLLIYYLTNEREVVCICGDLPPNPLLIIIEILISNSILLFNLIFGRLVIKEKYLSYKLLKEESVDSFWINSHYIFYNNILTTFSFLFLYISTIELDLYDSMTVFIPFFIYIFFTIFLILACFVLNILYMKELRILEISRFRMNTILIIINKRRFFNLINFFIFIFLVRFLHTIFNESKTRIGRRTTLFIDNHSLVMIILILSAYILSLNFIQLKIFLSKNRKLFLNHSFLLKYTKIITKILFYIILLVYFIIKSLITYLIEQRKYNFIKLDLAISLILLLYGIKIIQLKSNHIPKRIYIGNKRNRSLYFNKLKNHSIIQHFFLTATICACSIFIIKNYYDFEFYTDMPSFLVFIIDFVYICSQLLRKMVRSVFKKYFRDYQLKERTQHITLNIV